MKGNDVFLDFILKVISGLVIAITMFIITNMFTNRKSERVRKANDELLNHISHSDDKSIEKYRHLRSYFATKYRIRPKTMIKWSQVVNLILSIGIFALAMTFYPRHNIIPPLLMPTPAPTHIPTTSTIFKIADEYKMPNGEELSIPLSKVAKVYSGPGESYYRANNDKARVDLSVPFCAYAQDGDWTLIEYELGQYSIGHNRWGYIRSSDITSNNVLPQLPNANYAATVIEDSTITDDPNHHETFIANLKAGDKVLFLCSWGIWAYIEYENIRGFTLLSNLE